MTANNKNLMEHHIAQMKKTVGLKGDGTKYEFITSQDELINSYLHRMDDLGYPLRVEPKRDRYVVNKKTLEDALIYASNETLKRMDKEINDWIINDVKKKIEVELQDILNCINVVDNNFIVKTSNRTTKQNNSSLKFAERFGKAIGSTISNIAEDILFGNYNANKYKY